MESEWFKDKGKLAEYLELVKEAPEKASKDETIGGDSKIHRIPRLAFRLFVNKLGKEKFEELISGKLSTVDALKEAQIFLTRQAWAVILAKEFGYQINSDGLSGVFNHKIRHLFDVIKGKKPYVECLKPELIDSFVKQIRINRKPKKSSV